MDAILSSSKSRLESHSSTCNPFPPTLIVGHCPTPSSTCPTSHPLTQPSRSTCCFVTRTLDRSFRLFIVHNQVSLISHILHEDSAPFPLANLSNIPFTTSGPTCMQIVQLSTAYTHGFLFGLWYAFFCCQFSCASVSAYPCFTKKLQL